jgi:hypothetical protein
MKVIGIGIIGLVAFVLAFGDDTSASTSGAWKDRGYTSYTECKNSQETMLLGVQYKMKYPNVSDSTIKHMICN